MSVVYNRGVLNAFRGEIDTDVGTFKVCLLDSNHVEDSASTANLSAILANEITGAGYTSGGADLSNVAVTHDTGADEVQISADPVTWPSSTITARYAVVYLSLGNPINDIPLCSIDFGSDQSSSNGDFTINWNANGIFAFTQPA